MYISVYIEASNLNIFFKFVVGMRNSINNRSLMEITKNALKLVRGKNCSFLAFKFIFDALLVFAHCHNTWKLNILIERLLEPQLIYLSPSMLCFPSQLFMVAA